MTGAGVVGDAAGVMLDGRPGRGGVRCARCDRWVMKCPVRWRGRVYGPGCAVMVGAVPAGRVRARTGVRLDSRSELTLFDADELVEVDDGSR